ncbi:MAG TPA: OmpA family protein [Candidatus Babeliaceae bacterium]|nr:OmpA family protein [Candidatus Babeliaceae bacterium]
MNKYYLILGLILLPACNKQNSNHTITATYQAKTDNSTNIHDKDGYSKTPISGLFDEDIEAFILEEESNPFLDNEEKASDDLFIVEDKELQVNNYHQHQSQLKTLYFNFDQYILDDHQKKILDYNMPFLQEAIKQGASIVLEGHACNSAGSDVYNLMLSEKRAKSALNYLNELGIDNDRVTIVGRGSELCLVPHGNREQQAPNRRVEFHIFT